MTDARLTIIVSGIIAVASVIIAPIVNWVIDWVKWRRENEVAKGTSLNTATTELLTALQYFNTKWLPGGGTAPAQEKLYKAYFDWEMIISPYLKEKDNRYLEHVSKRILGENDDLSGHHPDLTNGILDFSKRISKRM